MEHHAQTLNDRSSREPVLSSGDAPTPDVSGVADQWMDSSDHELAEVPSTLDVEQANQPQRRVGLPLILFVATCLSTFWTGAVGLQGLLVFDDLRNLFPVIQNADWGGGLVYMSAVMSVLLAHEMGHFLMTLRYGVPASWPFFIPMLPPIGTMGAVIAMQGSKADRKQLFDIGLAGPIAGLLVCVPVLCLGIYLARPGISPFQQPLLTQLLVPLIRPDLAGAGLQGNPLLMAGWVGLLVTGLNMLPISQLDGGHVTYALFRRGAHVLAYAFLFVAIVFVVWKSWTHWVLMLALVVLIGVEHPRTANDNARLGPMRVALGLLSLAIPALCFAPRLFDERALAWLSMARW
jgi:membrane-associated protease RseP (regulator of RpoE activity)